MKTYTELFGLGKKKDEPIDTTPLNIGSNVKIKDKFSTYDGDIGVVVKVGSGSTEGYYMVKFEDGQISPFSRDRLIGIK